MYLYRVGYFASVRSGDRALAAMRGKERRMSAPVRMGPQRYPPPLGADINCCSRKPKCVVKLGSR